MPCRPLRRSTDPLSLVHPIRQARSARNATKPTPPWPHGLTRRAQHPFTVLPTRQLDEIRPLSPVSCYFTTRRVSSALPGVIRPATLRDQGVLKQNILSVVNYIATLPGFWQIVAYLSILALIVALFRALPLIIELLWDLTLDALELAAKYLWRSILYLLKLAFSPVAPLFSRLWSLTGILTSAEKRARGYLWIPGFGWGKPRPNPNQQHEQEQPESKTPQQFKKELEDLKAEVEQCLAYYDTHNAPQHEIDEMEEIKAKAERFIQYYDKKAKTFKTLPFLMPSQNKTPDQKPKPQPKSTTDPFKELESMIGLHPVKHQIRHLANLAKVQKLRVKAGLPVPEMSNHLVFVGNPGTGKTTVARLLGQIFKDIGILQKGHLIETNRGGMVAGYIGHTAPKVMKLVDEAMDGVLFIDEAYTLTMKESPRDLGPEAIATLITVMEDHRDRLIVIAAGYPDEMNRFIDANPGLKSRFKNFIHFPDYNPDELFEIFLKICDDGKYSLTPEAEKKLVLKIEQISAERGKGFGNARAIRNLFEQCLTRQAKRILALGTQAREDLEILDSEDIPEIQTNS